MLLRRRYAASLASGRSAPVVPERCAGKGLRPLHPCPTCHTGRAQIALPTKTGRTHRYPGKPGASLPNTGPDRRGSCSPHNWTLPERRCAGRKARPAQNAPSGNAQLCQGGTPHADQGKLPNDADGAGWRGKWNVVSHASPRHRRRSPAFAGTMRDQNTKPHSPDSIWQIAGKKHPAI